jgi:TolB-like protein
MKRNFLTFTALAVLLTLGVTAGAQTSVPDELDGAIRQASDYLKENIPAGSKLVILAVRSSYPPLSEYIVDVLSENVVNDRVFTVVDRANLMLIQQEMNFQLSGEVSDESAQSIGKKLGAQTIISGAITPFGSLWRLTIRALGVEDATIQGQFSRNIPNGVSIAALTSGGPVAAVPAPGSPVIAAPVQDPVPTQIPSQAVSLDTYRLIDTVPPYNADTSMYAGSNGGGVFWYPPHPYPNSGSSRAKMGGEEYDNYIIFTSRSGSTNIVNTAYFNFAGRYTLLTGIIGRLDIAGAVTNSTVKFYGDDTLIETITVNGASLPKRFSLNITGVNQLIIEHSATNNITALADLRLSRPRN